MTHLELAERLDAIVMPRQLKFGVYAGQGWITTSGESTIRLLCDIFNERKSIAAALRASVQTEMGEVSVRCTPQEVK